MRRFKQTIPLFLFIATVALLPSTPCSARSWKAERIEGDAKTKNEPYNILSYSERGNGEFALVEYRAYDCLRIRTFKSAFDAAARGLNATSRTEVRIVAGQGDDLQPFGGTFTIVMDDYSTAYLYDDERGFNELKTELYSGRPLRVYVPLKNGDELRLFVPALERKDVKRMNDIGFKNRLSTNNK